MQAIYHHGSYCFHLTQQYFQTSFYYTLPHVGIEEFHQLFIVIVLCKTKKLEIQNPPNVICYFNKPNTQLFWNAINSNIVNFSNAFNVVILRLFWGAVAPQKLDALIMWQQATTHERQKNKNISISYNKFHKFLCYSTLLLLI